MQVTDMAKNDNLGDFLTDIADAIRAKKGVNDQINAQDFAAEISSIESGGSVVPSAPHRDVTFVDIDGTILYSFSREQFMTLTSLPNLPTQEGLVCQGWNHTLEEAQSYVGQYGSLKIGATYMTDDGSTRLYIRIYTKGRKTVPLYFSQTVSQGVSIDWGDDTPVETLEGEGYVNTLHEYADIGDYIIRLSVSDGVLNFGSGETENCVMGSTGNPNKANRAMLIKAEIGSGVTNIGAYAFEYCHALQVCSIPKGVTGFGTYVFAYCSSLEHITIPSGLTDYSSYTFRDCTNLVTVSLPQGNTSFSTAIFYYCSSLTSINIPATVKSLGVYFLQYCYSLPALVMPNSVTSFGAFAMAACPGVVLYDFTAYTSVPALGQTNVFNNIPTDCKIVVKDELYDTWIATTNWSTYADRIIKLSDYDS